MKYCLTITLVMQLALACFNVSHAATITINSTSDTGSSACTLRLAIAAANTDSTVGGCAAGSGADRLNFSIPGTVLLASNLPTVTDEISINGFSTTGTIIDGDGMHRIFQIDADQSPAELAVSRISNITLTRGFSSIASGALAIRPGNDVTVMSATIINNTGRNGGGISLENASTGQLGVRFSLMSSNVESNIATGPAGGGGIRAGAGSTIRVTSSSIVRNRATHPNASGGGLDLFGSTDSPVSAVVSNSTIAINTANSDGGGISAFGLATSLEIVSSTITSNVADADLNSTLGGGRDGGGGVYIVRGTHMTLRNSLIATNITGFSIDDIYERLTATPSAILSEGSNLVGTNRSVSAYFPAGQPNTNNDYVGTTDDSLNATAMLEPLAFDENSQTNFKALGDTSLARNNAGQCGLEFDQLQRVRGVCECDIGAYEFFESSPDNNSCQNNFFVIPSANGKAVIIEL